MSVTFWIPAAPTKKINLGECPRCDGEGCDYMGCEDGYWYSEQGEHELNLANSNAALVLRVIGIVNEELCGGWQGEELSEIRQRIIGAMNRDRVLAGAERETVEDGNMISCGYSRDQIANRLGRLLEIVTAAQESGWEVSWG